VLRKRTLFVGVGVDDDSITPECRLFYIVHDKYTYKHQCPFGSVTALADSKLVECKRFEKDDSLLRSVVANGETGEPSKLSTTLKPTVNSNKLYGCRLSP
jgi:hypothetical protein